jgi:imidazolonepropionase-like amidohydrolase
MRRETKVVRCGRLIDGSGGSPKRDQTILVEGSTVRQIGSESEVRVPRGAEEIDASDKTVMPGLFDCHLHFFGMRTDNWITSQLEPRELSLIRSVDDARRLVEAGYTTVRDCAGMNGIFLRNAINEGSIKGPRILAAGLMLTQTFGAGDVDYLPSEWVDYRQVPRDFFTYSVICDGVPECMKAARFVLRQGADLIKIAATGGVLSKGNRPESEQFTQDEIKTIVREAANAGKFVAAHAMGTGGIRNCIESGVRTIDHAWYPDDECFALAKEKGTIFVPTLSWDLQIISKGVEAGYSSWAVEKERAAWKERMKRIQKARRAGVTLASGTDFSGSPLTRMGENAMELEALVKHCGYTPMEAIVAATANGAKACGLDGVTGMIEAGKLADILVVDGDPSRDISVLRDVKRIELVMKEGVKQVVRNHGGRA